MNAPRSAFGVFQDTIMLESKIRERTQELEVVLQTNAKITRALQKAKNQVDQSELYLREVTSALGEGFIVVNTEGMIEYVNQSACTLLGYTEADMLGRNSHELFHHSYLDHTPFPVALCNIIKVIQYAQPYVSEDEYFWRKNGTCFPVSLIATPINLKENKKGVVIAFHDIALFTEERNRLREMQAAIEQSPVSVIIFDKDKKITYFNPQLTKSTGYTKAELQSQKTNIFRSDLTPGDQFTELWNTILTGLPWKGEILCRRKDGSVFWQSWNVAPVIDDYGVIERFVGVGEDVTEKKKLQSILHEMSYLDGLTGIANRRRFDDFLKQECNRASRYATPIAVIMMDIDFFKRYNDTLGHQAGDDALKQVAQALKDKVLRSTDLLARYGGEEFTCILPDTDIKAATRFAETLRDAVSGMKLPHPSSEVSPYVTISLGVACFVPQKDEPYSLVAFADQALYRAKALGRNRIEVDM
jgi:diguanylate cyclase (GGDEF)-like protein/PAS domain S-box-containing protein